MAYAAKAFSSEADTGLREENASNAAREERAGVPGLADATLHLYLSTEFGER